MKGLDRFNLALFSLIVLVLSLLICLLSFGWIPLDMALESIKDVITNSVPSKIGLVMECKKPIITTADLNSHYCQMINIAYYYTGVQL